MHYAYTSAHALLLRASRLGYKKNIRIDVRHVLYVNQCFNIRHLIIGISIYYVNRKKNVSRTFLYFLFYFLNWSIFLLRWPHHTRTRLYIIYTTHTSELVHSDFILFRFFLSQPLRKQRGAKVKISRHVNRQ